MDEGEGQVISLAQKLLKKKPTPGWEFQRSRTKGLRGVKFHLYDDGGDERLIWVFACVADSSLEESQQKSFLEKLVYLTEPLRDDDYRWREGELLACQATFGPLLEQRMEQVAHQGRLAMVNQHINTTKQIMSDNIEMLLDRHESLEGLQEKSEELNVMAKQFKKRSEQIRRFQQWQNAKHGLLVGTAVTGVVAAVTVPPLVALLG